jgi:hypothetical protein
MIDRDGMPEERKALLRELIVELRFEGTTIELPAARSNRSHAGRFGGPGGIGTPDLLNAI